MYSAFLLDFSPCQFSRLEPLACGTQVSSRHNNYRETFRVCLSYLARSFALTYKLPSFRWRCQTVLVALIRQSRLSESRCLRRLPGLRCRLLA